MKSITIPCDCGRLIEFLCYDDDVWAVQCPICGKVFVSTDADKYRRQSAVSQTETIRKFQSQVREADEGPSQTESTLETQSKNWKQPQVCKKNPRIVILEDESWLVELYLAIICPAYPQAEIVSYANGDDAWNELTKRDPDLFIFDNGHPGYSGHEILRRLAERDAQFPMIFAAATDEYGGTQEQANKRFFEATKNVLGHHQLTLKCIPKPWAFEEMKQALREFLGPPTETTGIRVS